MFDKAEWQRQYRKTARGKEVNHHYVTSDKGRENARRYTRTDGGKQELVRYRSRVRDSTSLVYKARIAVGNAIRDGRLFKQPCEVCNNPKVEAHHDDYTKPLAVRGLCKQHHEDLHHKEKA